VTSTAMPAPDPNNSSSEVLQRTLEACRIAGSAATHAADALVNGTRYSFVAVHQCEEQLDRLDAEIDERVTRAVVHAGEREVRQLLACLKLVVDLERIGDLVVSFAERVAIVRSRIEMDDLEMLTRMASVLEAMLTHVRGAFQERDIDAALDVLRMDSEMDRLRNLVVIRHTEGHDALRGMHSLHVLFMAQALERAGDHVKNVAEEVCHLVSGHTVRHLLRAKDKPFEQMFLQWLLERNAGAAAPRRLPS